MRLCVGLVAALLGAARAGDIFVRQNASSQPTTSSPPTTQVTTSSESTTTPSTTPSTTSSTPSTPSTTSAPSTPTSQPTSPGPTTGATTEQDTTVFSTVFVTAGPRAASTVTRTTTVVETSYSVSTESRSDQQVETTTVYVTSTELVDVKLRRSADPELAPRTTAGPAQVDAVPTAHPAVTSAEPGALQVLQHLLFRRATKTSVTTVTVSNSEQPSVVTTFSVVTSTTTVVSVQTKQVNAKSTTTVTSTNVIRSTRMPSGTDIVPSASESSSSNSSGGGGGLSTGAQAGIGVGVALGALAVIGLIAWLLLRRRRNRRSKPDHDDFMGASEVPVGGPAGGSPSPRPGPMSETGSAGAGYLASGLGRAKPNTGAEGYRGTAMGDGRAGFAKPAPYGASYTPSGSAGISQPSRSSPDAGDQLPYHPTPGDSSVSPQSPSTAELGSDSAAAAKWHNPEASEIDSHAVMSHQSGPVYEMPAQSYR